MAGRSDSVTLMPTRRRAGRRHAATQPRVRRRRHRRRRRTCRKSQHAPPLSSSRASSSNSITTTHAYARATGAPLISGPRCASDARAPPGASPACSGGGELAAPGPARKNVGRCGGERAIEAPSSTFHRHGCSSCGLLGGRLDVVVVVLGAARGTHAPVSSARKCPADASGAWKNGERNRGWCLARGPTLRCAPICSRRPGAL